jgi:hypothetical protein
MPADGLRVPHDPGATALPAGYADKELPACTAEAPREEGEGANIRFFEQHEWWLNDFFATELGRTFIREAWRVEQ